MENFSLQKIILIIICNKSSLCNTIFVIYKLDGNTLKFRKFQKDIVYRYGGMWLICGHKCLSESWPVNDVTDEFELDVEYPALANRA